LRFVASRSAASLRPFSSAAASLAAMSLAAPPAWPRSASISVQPPCGPPRPRRRRPSSPPRRPPRACADPLRRPSSPRRGRRPACGRSPRRR
jgi:hypothetical protein